VPTSILGTQSPLYEIKANLFKGLSHPYRIRLLEILSERPGEPRQVSELIAATGLEPSHLSQHLAVLRRHGLVVAERDGSAVFYRLAHPKVAELLAIARIFLIDSLNDARDRIADARSLPPL
jgi:DNA-binding transcriptional ArsR family regulator